LTYRFDTFEVDDREFRLLEDGTPVQVEPKVLRLLLYLIENRNRLLRKQELLDKVWPDAMVTENALTRVRVTSQSTERRPRPADSLRRCLLRATGLLAKLLFSRRALLVSQ